MPPVISKLLETGSDPSAAGAKDTVELPLSKQ